MAEENYSSILSNLTSIALKCGTIVAGVVSIALGLLYTKQDSLLYFPEIGGIPRRPRSNPRRYRSPREYDIPYESHMIPTSDGALIHCWMLLQKKNPTTTPQQKHPTIIYFHGNAGNIGLRLPNASQMYHKLKANIALVEYRGYGDSSDHTPSEAGLKLDAEAALHFVQSYIDDQQQQQQQRSENSMSQNIYIFGRSLGGAVGFHLAQYADQKGIMLSGLIVENTFLSIGKMVDVLMPTIAPLKSLILRIDWDSEKIGKSLRLPVLYLAGAADELVPHEHMKILYQNSKHSSVLTHIFVIPNGTHNESWVHGGVRYWNKIASFMDETKDHQKMDRSTSQDDDLMDMDENSKGGIGKSSSSSSSTVAVGMGGADTTNVESDGTNDRLSTAIPIVPGNLMGIVREAATRSQKKKES